MSADDFSPERIGWLGDLAVDAVRSPIAEREQIRMTIREIKYPEIVGGIEWL